MGVVYDARQNSMDRRVALKVLPPGVAADDKVFNRFVREARIAGKLRHRDVVAIHAAGFDENTPYFRHVDRPISAHMTSLVVSSQNSSYRVSPHNAKN